MPDSRVDTDTASSPGGWEVAPVLLRRMFFVSVLQGQVSLLGMLQIGDLMWERADWQLAQSANCARLALRVVEEEQHRGRESAASSSLPSSFGSAVAHAVEHVGELADRAVEGQNTLPVDPQLNTDDVRSFLVDAQAMCLPFADQLSLLGGQKGREATLDALATNTGLIVDMLERAELSMLSPLKDAFIDAVRTMDDLDSVEKEAFREQFETVNNAFTRGFKRRERYQGADLPKVGHLKQWCYASPGHSKCT